MVINPLVGVYMPIIRIPIKAGMTIPNIASFDHGTYMNYSWPENTKVKKVGVFFPVAQMFFSACSTRVGGNNFAWKIESFLLETPIFV